MLQVRALDAATKKPTRQRRPANGATRKSDREVKQPRSFAWLNRLIILAGVGAVLVALVKAAVVLHEIPVERIVVTGKLERTQTAALQEMVQPALIGGFLSADLKRIQTQLESLPWVYEASVKRAWPSALEIHVLEQLPIARWGESSYLNHAGEVFHSTSANNPGSLPMLTGPEGSEQGLIETYQLLTEILRPLQLSVEELSVDTRGQVRAILDGGIEVIFGEGNLSDRLDRFVALYDSSLMARKAEILRVDIRYQSGIAVAFREPEALAET
jgi:cell division protein FtsQ